LVVFDVKAEAKSFGIDFRITADNLPKIETGQLNVVIDIR
jgi:hypothetical protein